ncbi:MAG: hypothetical protein AB7G28_25025 [Pirellulales bacterium]
MGRIYAGILGPLAMTVIIVRGIKDSAGIEGTLTIAIVALTAYAILGAVLGRIAQATVDESVRWKIEQQLATVPATSNKTGASGSKTE